MFCHVSTEQVLGVHDLISVYHVPLLLQSQGIVPFLQKRLNLGTLSITPAMQEKGASIEKRWREVTRCVLVFPWARVLLRSVYSVERFYETVTIVLVGKYTEFADSYMSVTKALEHSAFRCRRKLNLQVRGAAK